MEPVLRNACYKGPPVFQYDFPHTGVFITDRFGCSHHAGRCPKIREPSFISHTNIKYDKRTSKIRVCWDVFIGYKHDRVGQHPAGGGGSFTLVGCQTTKYCECWQYQQFLVKLSCAPIILILILHWLLLTHTMHT